MAGREDEVEDLTGTDKVEVIYTEDVPQARGPESRVTTTDAIQAAAEELAHRIEVGRVGADESPILGVVNQQRLVENVVANEKRRILLEEQKKRVRKEVEWRSALAEGRRPKPVGVTPMNFMMDQTIIMDGDGKPAGDPSKHKRIVRMSGVDGKPEAQRIGALAHAGYRPVRSRVTNKPIATSLGLLMEIDPLDEARRKAAAEAIVSQPPSNKELRDAIEESNREVGQQAFKFYQDPSHNAS